MKLSVSGTVDQADEQIDILVQNRKNKKAAMQLLSDNTGSVQAGVISSNKRGLMPLISGY